jgi:hypothetical protein
MDTRTIHRAQTDKLAQLFDADADAPTVYWGADLAAVLRHQLAAPLVEELSSPICGDENVGGAHLSHLDPSLATFGDLLHHSKPPIDLLKLAKAFAKSCRANAELLPAEVSTLIYYAVILVARIRLGEKITTLSDDGLRQGLAWGIEQPWVDDKTKKLLSEGAAALK